MTRDMGIQWGFGGDGDGDGLADVGETFEESLFRDC